MYHDIMVAHSTRFRLRYLFGGLLVLLIVFGVVFKEGIVMGYLEIRERISARDLYFISGLKFKEFQLKRLGLFKEESVVIPVEGRVIDYDRVNDRDVALVQDISGDEDVFVKINEDSWALLTFDGGIKSRLTLSPDGTRAAYAKRSNEDASNFFDPLEWRIYTITIETGEILEHEAGFAPQFFVRDDATFLAFLASMEFVIINLDTGGRQVANLNTFFDGRRIPRISPDGETLGVFTPRGIGTYDLYPIESTSPFIVGAAAGSLPMGTHLIEFSDDKIYAVKSGKDGVSTTLSVLMQNNISQEIPVRKIFDTPPAYQLVL